MTLTTTTTTTAIIIIIMSMSNERHREQKQNLLLWGPQDMLACSFGKSSFEARGSTGKGKS
jgi:hypothetical protein